MDHEVPNGTPERERDGRDVSNATTFLPSADDMREKIRQEMTSVPYDVAVYYHKTGFCRWIATHPRFEQLTLLVITLNALWIWVDTDANPGIVLLTSPPLFQIVEHAFCFYFTYEWSVRFGAFKRKRDGLKDAWFVFDSLLVSTMVFETWVMTTIFLLMGGNSDGLGNASILRMARLLRLTRMARMARLLRAMPELLILIKGMVAALRSVAFTLGLLAVILYIFGILFRQLCEDNPCQTMFPTVLSAMHVLLVNGALMDDLSFFVKPLQEQSIVLLILFYIYLLLAALTVMNMLIGVICEVVSAVAVAEREAGKLSFVREKIQELMQGSGADLDDDGLISKTEFEELLGNPKATSLLSDVGVDVIGLVDFTDAIFELTPEETEAGEEEKKLTFGDFMNVILDMRGSNTATFKDMVELRKNFNNRFQRLEKLLERNDFGRLNTASRTDSQATIDTAQKGHSVGHQDGLHGKDNVLVAGIEQALVLELAIATIPTKGAEVSTANAPLMTFPFLNDAAREELAAHKRRVTELRRRLERLEFEAETALALRMDRLVEPFSAGPMPVLADETERMSKTGMTCPLVSAADQYQAPTPRHDTGGCSMARHTNEAVPEAREPSKTSSARAEPTGIYSWSSMRKARQATAYLTGHSSQPIRPGCEMEEDSPRAI